MAVQAATCQEVGFGPPAPSCTAWHQGLVATGNPCSDAVECAAGWCAFDATCPGTCTVFSARGAGCSRDVECGPGSFCDPDLSACAAKPPPAAEGAPCAAGWPECAVGLYCGITPAPRRASRSSTRGRLASPSTRAGPGSTAVDGRSSAASSWAAARAARSTSARGGSTAAPRRGRHYQVDARRRAELQQSGLDDVRRHPPLHRLQLLPRHDDEDLHRRHGRAGRDLRPAPDLELERFEPLPARRPLRVRRRGGRVPLRAGFHELLLSARGRRAGGPAETAFPPWRRPRGVHRDDSTNTSGRQCAPSA